MKPQYSVRIHWSQEDQAYVITVPELPGCMADGQTQQEALENVQDIIREWTEVAKEEKREIPQPATLEDYARDEAEFRARVSTIVKQFLGKAGPGRRKRGAKMEPRFDATPSLASAGITKKASTHDLASALFGLTEHPFPFPAAPKLTRRKIPAKV